MPSAQSFHWENEVSCFVTGSHIPPGRRAEEIISGCDYCPHLPDDNFFFFFLTLSSLDLTWSGDLQLLLSSFENNWKGRPRVLD